MIETLTTKTETLSIIQEVRKWKEDHAAQYDFDVWAIGKALQAAQENHSDRIVIRVNTEPGNSEEVPVEPEGE